MAKQSNLGEMSNAISNIKREIAELKALGGDYNFIEMNITRMSAMIKMLELGISDVNEVLGT